jgi:hypothetical protein
MKEEARLYIIEDQAGRRMTVGKIQATWLEAEGHTEFTGYEQTSPRTGVNFYRSTSLDVEALNELVLAERDLRQCDFCHAEEGPWRIRIRRRFRSIAGPFKRDAFACPECAELIAVNRWDELVNRAVARLIRVARDLGQLDGAVSDARARQQIEPSVRAFAMGVRHNRDGYPVEDP